jgi:hypothetical protein
VNLVRNRLQVLEERQAVAEIACAGGIATTLAD